MSITATSSCIVASVSGAPSMSSRRSRPDVRPEHAREPPPERLDRRVAHAAQAVVAQFLRLRLRLELDVVQQLLERQDRVAVVQLVLAVEAVLDRVRELPPRRAAGVRRAAQPLVEARRLRAARRQAVAQQVDQRDEVVVRARLVGEQQVEQPEVDDVLQRPRVRPHLARALRRDRHRARRCAAPSPARSRRCCGRRPATRRPSRARRRASSSRELRRPAVEPEEVEALHVEDERLDARPLSAARPSPPRAP